MRNRLLRLIPLVCGVLALASSNPAQAGFGDYSYTTEVQAVTSSAPGFTQVFADGLSKPAAVNSEFPPAFLLNPDLGGGYVRAEGPMGYSSLLIENTTSRIEIFNALNKPVFDLGTLYAYSTSSTPVNVGTVSYTIKINLWNKENPGVSDVTPVSALFSGVLTGYISRSGVGLMNTTVGPTTATVTAGGTPYVLSLNLPANFESPNVTSPSSATGAATDYSPGFLAVSITTVAVPEPSVVVLLASGVSASGLLLLRRRRKDARS